MRQERKAASLLLSPSCVSITVPSIGYNVLTNMNRDPRLPLLGLEGNLPGEPTSAEEVSREQSRLQLG